MAALEMTVVSTAMPTVVGDLGGIQRYSWVFTAYLLSSTVTVPLYGKLADLYGRKPIMLLGIALFLLGSAASGLSQSMTQLIVFRTLQGLGAGSMQPTALTIAGDIFELKERARIQGVFGSVWGIAGLIGPMVGGVIVHYFSWRWVFYINLPFGIASAALLAVGLHERIERKKHSIDVLGAVLLAAAIILLLAAFQGLVQGAICAALATVLLVFLVRWERRVQEPLLPLDLFRRRVMAVASSAGGLIGAAMLSTVAFVPLFVQGVLGKTPVEAGSAITPMVVGWPIASAISGRLIPRIGFRIPIRVGLAISAMSALALAIFLRPGCSLLVPAWGTACFGLGLGLANTALLIAVQTSVTWEQRGVATASTMFFRTVGGALALGGLGAVLAAGFRHDPSIPAWAANQLLGPDHGASLGAAVLARLGGLLAERLQIIFWLIFALSAASFLISWMFPAVSTAPAAAQAIKVPELESVSTEV
ncbi:MAG TPA: MDR family MFS transporter [Myxococcaceae bacterium]|nr:MDR family MFS transporter [Myxococcaceae bacterium]